MNLSNSIGEGGIPTKSRNTLRNKICLSAGFCICKPLASSLDATNRSIGFAEVEKSFGLGGFVLVGFRNAQCMRGSFSGTSSGDDFAPWIIHAFIFSI